MNSDPSSPLGQGENARNAVAMIKGLPHTIHAHFLARSGHSWSSLDSANLMIPAADITLKHGGEACGSWMMLCILDALPSLNPDPDPDPALMDWQAGDAALGVIQFMHAIRKQIGRPATWHGVTPIMIFRSVSARVEV